MIVLRVAVIGAGIGAEHCAGYAALPERYSIHTVCDLDEGRGRAVAEQFGAAYRADFQVLLNDPDIDIVDICLPPHLHLNACLEALDSGKHVICEKPLVSALADIDILTDKSSETGKHVFPVFQYRFGLGMAQLHALIAAGIAGRCYAGSLETHWNRSASYYDNAWRGTWKGEQGGAVLGHAIHSHDLLTAILGPVERVTAELATRVNDIETEDCAALCLKMADGALITSSVTLGAASDTSRLRLMFEGFTVESDHAPYAPAKRGWHFSARAPTHQAQIDAVLKTVSNVPDGYAGLFDAIAAVLGSGKEAKAVLLEDGRRSVEFVTAVYASARMGSSVALPLENTHPFYSGWMR